MNEEKALEAKKWRKRIAIICAVVAVICISVAGYGVYNIYKTEKESEQKMEDLRLQSEPVPVPAVEQEETEEEEVLPNPYADIFAQNEDMAAWLRIEGTKIDYPVMQTMEDENYYLKRDFNGNEDEAGCLLLDTDSSLDAEGTTNQIIHGHNMKTGIMFGELDLYEEEEYCKEHNLIQLFTKDEQRTYEVIAVFYSQVYYSTDLVFKYYNFFEADTEQEFQYFYDNIKDLSLYDTGVEAELGDRFITLSTCSYQVEDGRFVVIGKEVETTKLTTQQDAVAPEESSEEDVHEVLETESEGQSDGVEVSQWLKENPGKLKDVSNRTDVENVALLDMDGDGQVEEFTLKMQTSYDYQLLVNDHVVIEDYAENMDNTLWAVSLNGEDILLVLYADGPSADPYTWFYRYENGLLQEAGSFAADVRECEFTEDGIIRGIIRNDVIQTDYITVEWHLNDEKKVEQISQDVYEFIVLNEVQMLQELTLYTEPDGGESFVWEPQVVKFKKLSGDYKWVQLENADGETGWLEVIDSMTVEDNKNTTDVFDWETMNFAG